MLQSVFIDFVCFKVILVATNIWAYFIIQTIEIPRQPVVCSMSFSSITTLTEGRLRVEDLLPEKSLLISLPEPGSQIKVQLLSWIKKRNVQVALKLPRNFCP